MEVLVVVILFLPLVVAGLVILASPIILVREWKKIRRGPAPDEAPDESADDEARPGRSPEPSGSNGRANGRANGRLPPGPRRR